MTIWVDAQLSPALAAWMREALRVDARALRELGLRDAAEPEIFQRARDSRVVLLTRDSDFVELVHSRGAPPQIVWFTMGNCSNHRLQTVLLEAWVEIEGLLRAGEPLVELRDRA